MSTTLERGFLLVAALVLAACAESPAGQGGEPAASGARIAAPVSIAPRGGCSAAADNPGAPSARASAAFAFDVDRGVMLLFGGRTATGFTSNDTWTWDARGWTQQRPSQSPVPVAYGAMAYDVIRHQMVLYLPALRTDEQPTTWTWDGVTWTQQHPAHVPPSRIEPAMVDDPSRGGVVLVGGTASGDLSDVWLWNGADWSPVAPDQGPVFGAAHAVVASPLGDGILLVVGNLGVYNLLNGAWSYSGIGWPPGTGFVGNVAYATGARDPVGFVRFGEHGETWTWLPGRDPAWRALTPACSPPGRFTNTLRPAMAYDGLTGTVVLFGGKDRNDTWTFDGRTWAPAAGGAAPPTTSPQPSSRTIWVQLPSLAAGRIHQTATLLADGRVLVAGGGSQAEVSSLASAEIFDPGQNAWVPAASMASARQRHTATLLLDGRVLVVGGLGTGRGTAELYDPTANSWHGAGSLVQSRADHAAVLLADGTVLVVGGRQPGRPLASAEVFDPSQQSWTAVAPLSVARDWPQAVRLPSGKVLVTGGVSTDVGGSLDAAVLFGNPLATTELYDPATRTWTAGAPMAVGRVGHVMALLPDGRVMVLAGTRDAAPVEIYDPARDSWSTVASMGPRIAPALGVFQDGRVIVAGGLVEKADPVNGGYSQTLLDTADLYFPDRAFWISVPPLHVARWLASGTVLGDGRFLVCAGGNPLLAGSRAAEAFPALAK